MAAKKTRRLSDKTLNKRLVDALQALAVWCETVPHLGFSFGVNPDGSVTFAEIVPFLETPEVSRYFYRGGELFLEEIAEAHEGRNKGKMVETTYKVSLDEPVSRLLGNNFEVFDDIIDRRVVVGKPRTVSRARL